MLSSSALYLDQEDITRRLLSLQDATGYEIVQKHGQRIYGGPPPGWSGPQPDKGTEVYCYRIPRDCFEDELVPVFSSVGTIYELRLMIEFSGTNRSYCYVRYTKQEEAREAIKKLNNHYVRPGYPLAVTRSVDNRKLSVKTIPPLDKEAETEEAVIQELGNVVEGVDRVRFQTRGWLEVEFCTHRLAALARRQLVPGNVIMFDRVAVKQVDWADPEVDRVGQDSQGKVISVRNVSSSISHYLVVDFFNKLSGGQVNNVLSDRNLVQVTFVTQEGAMLAMERGRDLELAGSKLELTWWSQRRLDRGSYSSQPRSHSHLPPGPADQPHQVMAGQSRDVTVDREMAWVTEQRNMMATQLCRQVSHPPPGYHLAQTFNSLSLATRFQPSSSQQYQHAVGQLPYPRSQQFPLSQLPPPSTPYSPPSSQYPPPPRQYLPPVSQPPPTPVISLPTYRQGDTFSLFPTTTTRPDSPRPVLAVPPVYRSGDHTRC